MDSSCSTPSSSRSQAAASSHLPHHLQQPSSSSTTGGAVHLQSVHNLRPGQLYVTVQTLSKENIVIAINPKTRVHHVLWKCGEILEIAEDKLFGLALRQPTEGIGNDQPRHEYFFLDPAQKIVKYAPKQPRFANWHNRSTESRPILVLYFRVRVYIDNDRLYSLSAKDEKALEQYYLQLKENFLDQWSTSHCVSEERCWEMAALALRSDKSENSGGYFRAEQYFPMWVIADRGLDYIARNMPAVSEDLKDHSKRDAMSQFCLEASRSPFALNCHLYGLRRHKMDNADNAVLGISARGIEMCDVGDDGERVPLRFLPWKKVTKFAFDRKKISIHSADMTKMSLYAQSENKARYLLELCRSVHQTLLVFSHKSAISANSQLPFTERSVDRASTSSGTGALTSEDVDSLLQDSVCSSGERLHGSVSSKQRIRIKLGSNLDVKIEKMELESIRQDRAASQSSKVSEVSEKKGEEMNLTEPSTPPPVDSPRPSSVDSASQTVDSVGSRQLDMNFNSKLVPENDHPYGVVFIPNNGTFPPDQQYTSSNGSRSDSVQQSHEALPEIMMSHSYYHDQGYARSDDADSTLRPQLHSAASRSLHDLRTTPSSRYMDQLNDIMMVQRSVSPNGKPRWTTVTGAIPSTYYNVHPGVSMQPGQARSEPKIDTDLWSHPTVITAALLDSPTSNPGGGRLFTKRTNSGASRQAASINRVRSMPAHYHGINGYQRNSPTDDYPVAPALQYAQSMNVPRKTREPPMYTPVAALPQMAYQQPSHGVPPNSCPLPAETPGGQPSFPPASVTPFNSAIDSTTFTTFMDDESIATEKLREYPLMHRLWKESQTLGHARRPSSCHDLTAEQQTVISQVQPPPPVNGMTRNDFLLENSSYLYGLTKVAPPVPANFNNGRGAPPAAVVLPPPPPYPNNRKAPLVM